MGNISYDSKWPMQFLGEHQHRIDAQGRVAIPARYREEFRHGIYLSKGLDPCVWVFSPQGWEEWAGAVGAMPLNQRRARVLRELVLGSAYGLDLDRQGRVLVPPPLRRYADLAEEVVIIGGGSFLGLWDRRRWEEQELPSIEEAASQMAEDGETSG